MLLNRLVIKGFRNLQPLELKFEDSQTTIAFVGANGQGKTNILESVYLCALSKSFRTKTNLDLIGFDEDYCSIKVGLRDLELEMVVTRAPAQKVLKVNGVKKTSKDFIGNLKAVFFSPDDLAYMSFAPKLRRRYLDVLLTQLSHRYLDNLMHYEEARKQRNALLKRIRDGESKKAELVFWDERLAEYGLNLLMDRRKLIKDINPLVQRHYKAISQSEDLISINYESEMGDVNATDDYLRHLEVGRERDLVTGKTQLGPHRDDLGFELLSHDMTHFASRGEWRSLVLALKFAEIDLIREVTTEQPILLLDDVFSELDEVRQKYLISAIKGSQTFITTTHREFVDFLDEKATVYRVEGGVVS